MSLLRVIAAAQAYEGLISPFGGMIAGWLLGGGTPSPLRRTYLRWRLAWLDREARSGTAKSRKASGLRVIPGGQSGAPTHGAKGGKRGPQGGWLN
jgi:hypothetical protein